MSVLDKLRAVPAKLPQLQQGDVLTRSEFERRYAAMPQLKKAELIEGIVYMASPVGAGVREYLVWIADESRLVWWRLADDEFVEIPADADGLMASVEFPGLVIDAAALTSGDLAAALARLG